MCEAGWDLARAAEKVPSSDAKQTQHGARRSSSQDERGHPLLGRALSGHVVSHNDRGGSTAAPSPRSPARPRPKAHGWPHRRGSSRGCCAAPERRGAATARVWHSATRGCSPRAKRRTQAGRPSRPPPRRADSHGVAAGTPAYERRGVAGAAAEVGGHAAAALGFTATARGLGRLPSVGRFSPNFWKFQRQPIGARVPFHTPRSRRAAATGSDHSVHRR